MVSFMLMNANKLMVSIASIHSFIHSLLLQLHQMEYKVFARKSLRHLYYNNSFYLLTHLLTYISYCRFIQNVQLRLSQKMHERNMAK